MTIFQAVAILLVLAGLASYLNYRFLGLPSTIGLMVIALVLSLTTVYGIEQLPPAEALPLCQAFNDAVAKACAACAEDR